MCGEKSGFGNAEWSVWLSHVDNEERIEFLFNDDGLFSNYNMQTNSVKINGIEGEMTIYTHSDKPNEYIESIVIKTDSHWFKIDNNEIKDLDFDRFYNSFKLLN